MDVFSTLPPELAARMRAIVADRETKNLNVHFLNAEGKPSRCSFANEQEAESFRNRLRNTGHAIT